MTLREKNELYRINAMQPSKKKKNDNISLFIMGYLRRKQSRLNLIENSVYSTHREKNDYLFTCYLKFMIVTICWNDMI